MATANLGLCRDETSEAGARLIPLSWRELGGFLPSSLLAPLSTGESNPLSLDGVLPGLCPHPAGRILKVGRTQAGSLAPGGRG